VLSIHYGIIIYYYHWLSDYAQHLTPATSWSSKRKVKPDASLRANNWTLIENESLLKCTQRLYHKQNCWTLCTLYIHYYVKLCIYKYIQIKSNIRYSTITIYIYISCCLCHWFTLCNTTCNVATRTLQDGLVGLASGTALGAASMVVRPRGVIKSHEISWLCETTGLYLLYIYMLYI
jgi:hypothetical protein